MHHALLDRCDAEFLVAERDGDVVGYLHYDSEGAEPELHRIYVDPGQKRGGVGSALMRELHARLPPGGQYILLVVEANKDAQAFYERHGLVIERRIDGPSYFGKASAIETDVPLPAADAIIMRFIPSGARARVNEGRRGGRCVISARARRAGGTSRR